MDEKEKFVIIIPTWNSMPEIQECIDSIVKSIPVEHIHDMILIDRYSTDDTKRYAEKNGFTVIIDDVGLGNARYIGNIYANDHPIIFIDSDIVIDDIWYKSMVKVWNEHKDIGMLFGRTIDRGIYGKIKRDKLERDFRHISLKDLQKGDRGYTHNTFIRGGLLDGINGLSELDAWEDWFITQHIFSKGYRVVETTYTVEHIHDDIYGAKLAWCIRGMIKTRQPIYRIVAHHIYYLFEGFRSCVCNNNPEFLKWGIANFLNGFKGYFYRQFRRD